MRTAELVDIIKELLYSSNSGCPLCGRPGSGSQLCSECLYSWAELTRGTQVCRYCATFLRGRQEQDLCRACLRERPPFLKARAVAPYQGPVRDGIYLFKYAGKRDLACPFGRLMATLVKEVFPFQELQAVLPVPLHPAREQERGFNQSLLLGQQVAHDLRLPIFSKALIRCRETPSQSSLTRSGRHANLIGAFSPGTEAALLQGQTVLLVDDVYTTGATTSEAANTLLKAGVAAVYVVTLASGIASEEVEAES